MPEWIRKAIFCAALLSLGAPGASSLLAQGPTIVDIQFKNLRSLSEESVLYYLGLAKGQALDEGRLNQRMHDLWGRRLVDDLKVTQEPAPGGVLLVVEVRERPVLRSITYQGLKRLGSTDINDRILRERVQVREGEAMDFGELQRLKGSLEEMYREKGYRFAEVKFAVEEISAEERRVVFTVDEGDKVRIAGIQFEGAEVADAARLRWAMKKTKESAFVSRVLKRDVYNPATLAEDLDKVRQVYQRAGYKNVKIGEPRLEVRALNPAAKTIAEQDRQLFLTIPIDEGERWKMGEISIEGNEKYGDQVLLGQFRRRPKRWLKSKLIDDGEEKVSETYRNTGFINASVTTELREREGQVADAVLHVIEGDQYTVGRLEFQGNDRTMDKVLRREFRLHEGMYMNMGGLKNSLLKLRQLEFFKPDENDPVEFQNVDSEKKTIDLLIKGTEADRTELEFGAAYNEIEGFSGQFSIRTRNFLGRGESLEVSVISGDIREEYTLAYGVPWFLDRAQSLSVRAFKRDSNYSSLQVLPFQIKETGGVVSYGRSMGYFSSVSLGLSGSAQLSENTFASAVLGPIPSLVNYCTTVGDGTNAVEKCDRTLLALAPQYSFNSVDSRFEPTRGRRLSATVSVTGGLLGGDTYYYRPEVSYAMFRPVTNTSVRTVAGLNFGFGMIEPFGGRGLARQDLVRLGREVRGFDPYSIIARKPSGEALVDDVGIVVGGNKWFSANFEYHFLLGGPFRLVVFADAANVLAESQSWSARGLRRSAGAEFRILVPMLGAPLRFIYAKNLDPIENPGLVTERFETFQFDIGFTF
jgi:outer membrane protein insertion porin family